MKIGFKKLFYKNSVGYGTRKLSSSAISLNVRINLKIKVKILIIFQKKVLGKCWLLNKVLADKILLFRCCKLGQNSTNLFTKITKK